MKVKIEEEIKMMRVAKGQEQVEPSLPFMSLLYLNDYENREYKFNMLSI